MTTLDAINIRRSNRKYIATPIDHDIVEKLRASIEKYNKISNLSIQLILNNKEPFNGLRKSYGMFSGVDNYIALVGQISDENLKEKSGYYGEKLVLEATQLGLGTCWVGGTFDKKSCVCKVKKGEIFYCVITIGNIAAKLSFKENLILKVMHRKTKSVSEMYESDSEVPEWFLNGMQAVQKAPSAVNMQPVTFYFKNGVVSASVKDISAHQPIDMGIAKLHFELGADCGTWELGKNFILTK